MSAAEVGRATVAASHPALVVADLDVSYGAHEVLVGAGLTVAPGEVVALVGPSGCGKTTLVRAVAGFEHAQRGTIALAGRLVGRAGDGALHLPPERRRVGVVPQEGALFPHLDVAGNVGFGLPRGGRTGEGRARVAQLLELVGLARLGGRRPDQLSGGQQQRVAVARALAPRPELVLLDEPFSALDASLRVSVREAVMAAVRAEGAAALLVTHDQDEALSVADTVAVMLDGRIAQVGSPEQVYQRPVSAAVAQFLGEALVLPGQAEGGLARCCLGEVALVEPTRGAVTVLLRPEQVLVEPVPPTDAGGGARATGADRPRAIVSDVSFHGHDALIGLRLPDGTALQSRVPGGWLPRAGEQVDVRVCGRAWPLPG